VHSPRVQPPTSPRARRPRRSRRPSTPRQTPRSSWTRRPGSAPGQARSPGASARSCSTTRTGSRPPRSRNASDSAPRPSAYQGRPVAARRPRPCARGRDRAPQLPHRITTTAATPGRGSREGAGCYSEPTAVAGDQDGLSAVDRADLAIDVVQVRADGAHRKRQLLRDLLVDLSLGEAPQRIHLA
jgi:hypothetical protein